MVNETTSVSGFLLAEYERRVKSNARYSQRAFARDLGLSPGELSEILRGKRSFTHKKALYIANKLGLSQIEVQHLIKLTEAQLFDSSRSKPKKTALFPIQNQLSIDVFKIVSDWVCFAILNLIDTKGFVFEEAWIAKRLDLNPLEVRAAIDRLDRVGLIEKTSKTIQAAPQGDWVLSPAGIPSEAIRNYHKSLLKKAEEALDHQTLEERDFNGIGFSLDTKNIPAIKKEIKAFNQRILKKYSTNKNATEVYHLETALFRITKPEVKS